MKQLGKIRKEIEQTKDLSNVIRTMKNISAVNITHFEREVQAVREYYTTIEKGFQILLKKNAENLLPRLEKQNRGKGKGFGAILIGSEKGLCGEFNEKLVQFFHNHSAPKGEVTIIAIGFKIASRLEKYKIQSYEFPSTREGISELLRELLKVIRIWIEEKNIKEIGFYYNALLSGLLYEPKFELIFPLNLEWLKSLQEKPWESRCLPTYFMETDELFYELTQELLFISMYRAFIESLASENSGRLSSMQAAEKNIDDRLSELQKNYQLQRQSSITEELLDILSGFEVLRSNRKH